MTLEERVARIEAHLGLDKQSSPAITSSTLKNLRINARLTREQLADATGVSQKTIRNIENGHVAEPRVETLWKLAAFYECEPADLALAFEGDR